MKKRIIITGLVIVFLGLGFTTIKTKDLDIVKNLDIYCTLFRELNMFYVDETNPEKLVNTSINSMLKSLDPYTTYIPESEMDDFNFQTTGEYGGIGSLIRKSGDHTIIAEPYDGFPAARAGLRPGDILLEIDGENAEGLSITAISEKLKGKPGTKIKIKIKREEEIISHVFEREQITVKNVPYFGMLDDHTGYIRLSNFTTNAAAEVRATYKNLDANNELNSLVLDLRSNPGGLLIEAVRTCNLFIDKGELIVSTKGKVIQWDSEYKTSREPIDTEIPIAVLVNRSSASAAEIVAGAMQDLDRGVVIGQRTFGKGLVQATRPLKYNAQLKVTTAKYYIPSGRCIQMLDYAHRNDDGSVGSIPDSLISEYATKNGRPVFDGGGVQPDIKVESEFLSEIAVRLYTESVFFDYATKYRNQHDAIDSPTEFILDDAEYENFKSFILTKDFKYKTVSEVAFNKLIETAKKEKYYKQSEEEFLALEEKLAHSNLKDLETYRPEIQRFLEEEIVGRYYFQAGRIQAQIDEDESINEAIQLMGNPVQVQNILNGTEGALAIKK